MPNTSQLNEALSGSQSGTSGAGPGPTPSITLGIVRITDHYQQAADRFAEQFRA